MAPVINGLVLAGGKSLRMGTDKSLLNYHGRPQREHLYDLLLPLCSEVHISCNAAQAGNITLPKIEDGHPDAGPLGGIRSAMIAAPGKAWLVVACDLPYLSRGTIEYLIAHRSPAKAATVFVSPEDSLPEPLVAIWEPGMLPVLSQALSAGDFSLRRVLMLADVMLVQPPVPLELRNANDPAIFTEAIAHLKSQSLLNASNP